ncbi:MAG: FeoB-associated Cys-rich membrane protein [bacterium]
MKLIDIVLIAVLGVVVFFAVRHTVKTRRSGGCGCGCAGCTRSAACKGRTTSHE